MLASQTNLFTSFKKVVELNKDFIKNNAATLLKHKECENEIYEFQISLFPQEILFVVAEKIDGKLYISREQFKTLRL